jgi:hypothetical protein
MQLLKLKHSYTLLWKQLGQNGYQNASISNARKGINKYKKSSMKYPLGCCACSPGQQPSLQSAPPTVLAVLRPRHVWVRHSLLAFLFWPALMSLKRFHSYCLRKQTYLLMKTLIQIFSLIFPKISGREAALHSLFVSHPDQYHDRF